MPFAPFSVLRSLRRLESWVGSSADDAMNLQSVRTLGLVGHGARHLPSPLLDPHEPWKQSSMQDDRFSRGVICEKGLENAVSANPCPSKLTRAKTSGRHCAAVAKYV